MARKEGSLKLSSNIEPRAAAPLDARTIVPTLADLTASGAFPYPYVGMIVSVQSEGKAYMLTAADTTSSSSWMPIGSESFVITATLDKDDWDSETRQQTIDFSGYDENMIGVIGMPVDATDEEKAAYSAAAIDVVERDGTEFTFQCTRIPEIDLPVTLFVGAGGGASIVDAVTEGDMRAPTSNAVYEEATNLQSSITNLQSSIINYITPKQITTVARGSSEDITAVNHIKVYQIGYIVYINISVQTVGHLSSGEICFTGFPIPKDNIAYLFGQWEDFYSDSYKVSFPYRINNQGQIVINRYVTCSGQNKDAYFIGSYLTNSLPNY